MDVSAIGLQDSKAHKKMEMNKNNFNDQHRSAVTRNNKNVKPFQESARESIKIYKLWHFKVCDKACLKHFIDF